MTPVSFPINEVRSLFFLAGTGRQLRDPHSSFYHCVGALNQRVEQVGGEHPGDVFLKGIWKQFAASFYARQTPETDKRLAACIQELHKHFPKSLDAGLFSDTDLMVYPDAYEESIPINGVGETAFGELEELYLQFALILKIEGSDAFRERVLKDIRIILTRPLGRELIWEIVSRMTDPDHFIYILPFRDCRYASAQGEELIGYCTDPVFLLQVLPNGESATLSSPAFMGLAHEFIHLLHQLTGEIDHIHDPTVPRLNSNREESRTIFGDCGTAFAARCHRIARIFDNALRKQFFGLLLRGGHHAGYTHAGCASCNFKFAARHAILGNVRQLVRQVSTGTLNETIARQLTVPPTPTSPNPRAAVQAIIEEAMEDRSLRQGPFLSALPSPTQNRTEAPRQNGAAARSLFSS